VWSSSTPPAVPSRSKRSRYIQDPNYAVPGLYFYDRDVRAPGAGPEALRPRRARDHRPEPGFFTRGPGPARGRGPRRVAPACSTPAPTPRFLGSPPTSSPSSRNARDSDRPAWRRSPSGRLIDRGDPRPPDRLPRQVRLWRLPTRPAGRPGLNRHCGRRGRRRVSGPPARHSGSDSKPELPRNSVSPRRSTPGFVTYYVTSVAPPKNRRGFRPIPP